MKLKISGKHYNQIRNHLFPGDGLEAVAVALCGRSNCKEQLMVHKVICIPYNECSIRKHDIVKWSTQSLLPNLEIAEKKNLGIVKFHSHPTSYEDFSKTDNVSDKELFDSIYGWMNTEDQHASVVMLPDGKMFGRTITPNLTFKSLDSISVIGDDLMWFSNTSQAEHNEFELRTVQAFGEGTVNTLHQLKICVIGCSGTGSPTIEQLARLGVGEIVMIDDDEVEQKNLNRILNTSMKDVGKKKVDVIAKSIAEMNIGTKVTPLELNICDTPNIIHTIASCDVIFGCVDSIDARHLLNQISTFYLVPYFDLGVKLSADGKGGVSQICGSVHYVQPGGSSLKTRGLFSAEELRALGLRKSNIEEYNELKKSGYITNIAVESPAVISVNMQISSIAINEFLARIHNYRYDDNGNFAIMRLSLTDSYIQYEGDGEPDKYLAKYVGRGNMAPLLNTPGL